MKTASFGWCLVALLITLPTLAHDGVPEQSAATRFGWVDVFVQAGETPLAAYQFQLRSADPSMKIVGVEGGDHAAFADAPYYDPAALQRGRIVVGDFSTADNLPSGRTRVARIHLMYAGETPHLDARLLVAAGSDGRPIAGRIQLEQGASS